MLKQRTLFKFPKKYYVQNTRSNLFSNRRESRFKYRMYMCSFRSIPVTFETPPLISRKETPQFLPQTFCNFPGKLNFLKRLSKRFLKACPVVHRINLEICMQFQHFLVSAKFINYHLIKRNIVSLITRSKLVSSSSLQITSF